MPEIPLNTFTAMFCILMSLCNPSQTATMESTTQTIQSTQHKPNINILTVFYDGEQKENVLQQLANMNVEIIHHYPSINGVAIQSDVSFDEIQQKIIQINGVLDVNQNENRIIYQEYNK